MAVQNICRYVLYRHVAVEMILAVLVVHIRTRSAVAHTEMFHHFQMIL